MMKWKIFQWMKFLFRHSSKSRKLSPQKFHYELACVFTAHYASKNAVWNQQQLKDGGILANRNNANHSCCFLSNHKKSPDSGFLRGICDRNVSCPPPENNYRDKGRRHDRRLDVSWLLLSVSSLWFSVSLSLSQMSSASLPFSEARILPPLHNRTHKTALGGMGASVSQAHETLY